MKYPENSSIVPAVYDDREELNPLLAAMPPMLSPQELFDEIKSAPPLPAELPRMTTEERRASLPLPSSLFFPVDYMYEIYNSLFLAILTAYQSCSSLESIRREFAFHEGPPSTGYGGVAHAGAILGVRDIGKTSTVNRCLATMPQVIEHKVFRGQSFNCKQIPYLKIQCSDGCTAKDIVLDIVRALDKALGSSYFDTLPSVRTSSASMLLISAERLCLKYHVGVVVIDDIQNAFTTAQKKRKVETLSAFLSEFTNVMPCSVILMGDLPAENLFTSNEHIMRRTRGLRLFQLRPGEPYRLFLEQLWPYQYTQEPAPLDPALADKLYVCSGGIPADTVKLFIAAQDKALLKGQTAIDETTIALAAEDLEFTSAGKPDE